MNIVNNNINLKVNINDRLKIYLDILFLMPNEVIQLIVLTTLIQILSRLTFLRISGLGISTCLIGVDIILR